MSGLIYHLALAADFAAAPDDRPDVPAAYFHTFTVASIATPSLTCGRLAARRMAAL